MTDRAVSVTVNYVLTITIATLLLSLLFVSAGGLIESQTEETIRSELEVLGQQLAADIESADRLATVAEGGDAEVRIETRLPHRVAGTEYTIDIDDGEIELRSTDPEIKISVQFMARTNVEPEHTIRGGDVLIEWEDDTLEVKNA
jgi:hypothetical protein